MAVSPKKRIDEKKEITVGTVVLSLAGRDRGRTMLVIARESEYLFLADGKTHTLGQPKKKQIKHVKPLIDGPMFVSIPETDQALRDCLHALSKTMS